MSVGKSTPAEASRTFDDVMIAYSSSPEAVAHPNLVTSPLLSSLRRAGTGHIYADTADTGELGKLLAAGEDAILAEVDGNTANQPLVHKVIERYLETGDPAAWSRDLCERRTALKPAELLPFLYAIVCGRIGNDITSQFAGDRSWEVSLQLHMGLCEHPERAKEVGRYLRGMVPSAFVKVPFTPHAPGCFLVARDLEREEIPVNFTSTFSARQTAAAALLSDVSRTNIFMGRLNQGLRSQLLGEHVDLEAQRALRRLRQDFGIKTQLIVASMREWQTFVRTAGCDVYTAPCSVIDDFLTQTEVSPSDIRTQLETSYEDRLGIPEDVKSKLGQDRIARLYRVEPEFIEFLREYRGTAEYHDLTDGDTLYKRFDDAGFGDVFYAPSETDWREIRRHKIPDLDAALTKRLPLDTLYSLLADADFEKYQDEMDQAIERRIPSSTGGS